MKINSKSFLKCRIQEELFNAFRTPHDSTEFFFSTENYFKFEKCGSCCKVLQYLEMLIDGFT